MTQKNKFFSAKKLVRCALVAALYTVLCLAFAPLGFGAVQVRFAEALCLLPVFGAEYIIAISLGCLISNFLGSTIIDVVFGTLATLLAGIVTYLVRNRRIKGLAIPAAIPPIVFNAVIVGAVVISFFFMDGAPVTGSIMLFNAFTVGLGEVISCGVLGVLLVKVIESNTGLRRLFIEE